MKRLIIIIVLFFMAIAISPMLINEKGYILIAMGDTTIESTVVTAIIMLILVFIALIFSLKIFRGSWSLGLGTWNKLAFASRRRGLRNFNKGLAAYILDDYQQAEHLLAKAAEPSQLEQLSYILAASASEKQALPANTKHYLQLLDTYTSSLKDFGLEAVLVKVKLLISQKEYAQARAIIDEHHKHIGHDPRLLKLEIDLCLIEKRFEAAIEYLNLARKQKTLSDTVIRHWEKVAFYGAFSALITTKNNEALHQYWQKLAGKIKQREEVLFAYCRVLGENSISEPLNNILTPALKKDASDDFLHRLQSLPIKKPDALIVLVQKHLHKEPTSAKWLSCLGHLALAGQQWSMAEKAFNSLLHIQNNELSNADLKACAQAKAAQGNHQNAYELLARLN